MIGQHGNGRRSESWPAGRGIRVAVFALLPLLTLNMARYCAAQTPTSNPAAAPGSGIPAALTGKERWNFFLGETFRSYAPYVVSFGAGLAYQAFDYPKEWGGGFKGYGLRTAGQYGLLAAQNAIHDGGAAVLRYDPRYFSCACTGPWRRTGHALKMSFLTYDEKGHKRLDLPQLVGAYGSGMLSAFWYPKRYSPLVQGMQAGHMQFAFVLGTHLFQEFSPELKRMWPFHKIVNHQPARNN